ncbi:MAG: methyltransferase domain-containing protein [Chitinivibrionales bacterium]|nr:methyltransferase domain-containing protein [Chitinivibrionales bacterium]MBD3394900.1 methyltransferase domain-containing protein [Chitinivibrionales bacterium]
MNAVDIPCNLCGSRTASLYQETGEAVKVVRCATCGLVYLHPQPAVPSQHYGEEYFDAWHTRQAPQRARMWDRRLADIRRYRASGHLLDVGCGLGTFLAKAREAGYDVEGTEITALSARRAVETHGITVHTGDLPDVALPGNAFDLVTFWHSLEHTPNPGANLKKAFGLLKPRGMVVVAVPNLDNHIMRAIYRIVKGRPLPLYTKDMRELHLFPFARKTLVSMIRAAGFKIFTVGVDRGQVMPAKRALEWIGVALHALTGRNFADAQRVYAVKPSGETG